MQIRSVRTWKEDVPLTRPYEIARRRVEAVELFYAEISTDAHVGLGSASPSAGVTGESADACTAALAAGEALLTGQALADAADVDRLERLLRHELPAAPAARAALDGALWDLRGRLAGRPVVELLGGVAVAPLPTSITVGIQSTEAALADVEEYLGRGFRCLKLKIGLDWRGDEERLRKIRELAGPEIAIRVDGNQGYGRDETTKLFDLVERLDLELVEQPLPVGEDDALRTLPAEHRRLAAADESLVREGDADRLLRESPDEPRPYGIWNLKLMKHGGPSAARRLARRAGDAGIRVMWGCNDESVASLAAALHAAYASPATRWLDLDGSFDLAADRVTGGFALRDGALHLLDAPGLGVELRG